LCVLETARLLLAAPHAANEEHRAQVGCASKQCGSSAAAGRKWM
jgi:hypothetical protein